MRDMTKSVSSGTAHCDTAIGAVVDLPAPAAGGGAPEWIHLMALGEIPLRDGRPAWFNEAPADVIATSLSAAGGRDLPIDYDHQIDLATRPGVGGTAKAAGWIKELQLRADGIWGRVEWTAAASQAIADREYRYISPVFDYRRTDRQVTFLRRAALTNNPAMTLTALSHQQQPEEVRVDPILKALLEALGLKPDTDQATAVAHAQALVGAKATVDKVAAKLGVTGAVTETALASAIDARAATEPDPARFAPIETVNALQTALATIQSERAAEKAATAVAAAMKAGKVIPAQKDWATAYAAKDPEGFADWVGSAPIVAAGGTVPVTDPGAADGGLSAEDLAICSQLGVSPEDFKKTRATERGVAQEG